MQEKNLYEYAVVRVVPKVEREEFMNIGVILFCKNQHFLKVKFVLNNERLNAFSSQLDWEDLKAYLNSWEQICAGGNAGGTIGMLPLPSRFRWLTATRSTVLQTSKVHSGLCENAEKMLTKLMEELVF